MLKVTFHAIYKFFAGESQRDKLVKMHDKLIKRKDQTDVTDKNYRILELLISKYKKAIDNYDKGMVHQF